jgi:hypothetical protein
MVPGGTSRIKTDSGVVAFRTYLDMIGTGISIWLLPSQVETPCHRSRGTLEERGSKNDVQPQLISHVLFALQPRSALCTAQSMMAYAIID